MKIVYLADSLVAGGLETHIISFVNELLRRGHSIMLSANFAAGSVLEQIENPEQRFSFVPWSDQLLEHIRSFNPDIIHAHPFTAIVKGARMVKELNKPYIVTVHGGYDFGLDRSPTGNLVSQQVKRIIAVDMRVINVLLRSTLHPEKVSVIRNGIDLKQYIPMPAAQAAQLRSEQHLNKEWFTIVTLCRLGGGKEKPVLQLLRSAGRIAAELGGLNIVVVGGDTYYDAVRIEALELQKQYTAQQIPIQIRMMGNQKDVRPFIGLSDMVMGCGRGALEALACKRPVFGMQYGFAGPVDATNYNEVLFNISGFAPMTDEMLIHSIVNFSKDQERRNKSAEEGYGLIKRYYNISVSVDQLLRIYEQYL